VQLILQAKKLRQPAAAPVDADAQAANDAASDDEDAQDMFEDYALSSDEQDEGEPAEPKEHASKGKRAHARPARLRGTMRHPRGPGGQSSGRMQGLGSKNVRGAYDQAARGKRGVQKTGRKPSR
jgi:hypothetical protein